MIQESLVADIRRLFLDGATPSQLMQRIAAQHPNDPRLHFLIADYFRAAFQIPLLRNVVPNEDYSPGARHAHYNRDVIPEIVRLMPEWNSEEVEGGWLDKVVVRSLSEHQARVGAVQFEELGRVWETLNDEEKQFIQRKIAMKDYYWEVLKCLASLAERLQEKLAAQPGQQCEQALALSPGDNATPATLSESHVHPVKR